LANIDLTGSIMWINVAMHVYIAWVRYENHTKGDGLPQDCAVNCDHLQTVSKAKIGPLIASLSPSKLTEVGRAIRFALDI